MKKKKRKKKRLNNNNNNLRINLFGEKVVNEKILIDREILTGLFLSELRNIDEKELVSMMYSKYEAIVDFARLCDGRKTGQKISMLFNPHRYSISAKCQKSFVESFKDESFLSGLSRASIWREKTANVKSGDLLYIALQTGINGRQNIDEFPPHGARHYYLNANAKKILDPCAGWGGRMIGAASIGAFYYGFEPATKTYEGLIKLGNFLKLFKTGFDFKVECLPFEDAKIKGMYDFALTSPPYYDTERYSDEKTNSCNRYRTYKKWLNCFFFPLIDKTLQHVKSFIINLGNRKYNLTNQAMKRFKLSEVAGLINKSCHTGKEASKGESFYLVERK